MFRTETAESARNAPAIASGSALAATVAMACGLFLAGCGSEDPEQSEPAPETTPRMIEREAPQRNEPNPAPAVEADEEDFRVVPNVDGALEEDGMGLDVIIDASNRQAYADSLRWIAEDASKEQFQQLESAIRYIHIYDPTVFSNEDRMLKVIDGKTGQEVIDYATRLRNQRRGR